MKRFPKSIIFGIENMIFDLREVKDKIEDFNQFLQRYSDDKEIINILHKIIEIDNIYDVKRLIYNRVDNSFLDKYDILKRIENENIIKLLTYHKNDLFIFWINNFEDVNTINQQVFKKLISDIKELKIITPKNMLFFLNFTSSSFLNLNDLSICYFNDLTILQEIGN